MRSWLDRCESVCCPGTDLLSADKMKLRNELQVVEVDFFFFNSRKYFHVLTCYNLVYNYICTR